jgi:fucose 4-O-acetylase-like acetyltransferase
MQRSIAADFVKGVMIILVVYAHVTHLGTMLETQKQVVSWVYSFHMPVFLCVSGFFFSASYREMEMRILLRRIVAPYFLFITVYLLALVLAGSFGVRSSTLPPDSFSDFLRIVFLHPRGSYWFLHAIAVAQLFFMFTRLPIFRLPGSVAFVIGASFLFYSSQAGIVQFRVVIFFLIGMLARQLSKGFPSSLLMGFIVASVALVMFPQSDYVQFSAAQIGWALGILMFLSGVAEKFPRLIIVNGLAWIGKNTLIILLTHAFFLLVSRFAFGGLVSLDSSGIIYSVAVTGFSTLGCILIAKFLDRVRLSKLIFGAEIYAPYDRFHLVKDKASP